jgi:hypothetical protein
VTARSKHAHDLVEVDGQVELRDEIEARVLAGQASGVRDDEGDSIS